MPPVEARNDCRRVIARTTAVRFRLACDGNARPNPTGTTADSGAFEVK